MCNVLRMRSTTRKRFPAYRACSVNTNARLRPIRLHYYYVRVESFVLKTLDCHIFSAFTKLSYSRKNQPAMNSKKENLWNGRLMGMLLFLHICSIACSFCTWTATWSLINKQNQTKSDSKTTTVEWKVIPRLQDLTKSRKQKWAIRFSGNICLGEL